MAPIKTLPPVNQSRSELHTTFDTGDNLADGLTYPSTLNAASVRKDASEAAITINYYSQTGGVYQNVEALGRAAPPITDCYRAL